MKNIYFAIYTIYVTLIILFSVNFKSACVGGEIKINKILVLVQRRKAAIKNKKIKTEREIQKVYQTMQKKRKTQVLKIWTILANRKQQKIIIWKNGNTVIIIIGLLIMMMACMREIFFMTTIFTMRVLSIVIAVQLYNKMNS